MKKVLITIISILILVPVIVGSAFYLYMNLTYKNTFAYGMFINNCYVEGMTPEQVNEKLVGQIEPGKITVQCKMGNEIEIPFEKIGYTYSYLEQLRQIQKNDNPIAFAMRMYTSKGQFMENEIAPEGTFDEAKLRQVMQENDSLKDCSKITNPKVCIENTKNGYVLIDETVALLDGEKAQKVISLAIKDGKETVDLEKSNCYISYEYTPQMLDTLSVWKKVDTLIHANITYVLDDLEETIEPSEISQWIMLNDEEEKSKQSSKKSTKSKEKEKQQESEKQKEINPNIPDFKWDEDGNLVLDKEKIAFYIEQLANKYDTVDKTRIFKATSGRAVKISNSNYGDKIDQKAEVNFLMEEIPKGKATDHIPSYSQRAFAAGEDDIGDTYIEVDMSKQTLYYYRNGRLMIETPVVTGNTSLGRGTPEKVCYVYFKQRNRILRGEDYATPVSYWIAVNGHIGIHDANWRYKFGGNIYKTNGSHGCVNTPTKAVSKLYDLVELGTPVIIFY